MQRNSTGTVAAFTLALAAAAAGAVDRPNVVLIFTAEVGYADAAVDPRLRVRGVDGLRMVDASVMPKLPGRHPSATVFAIAERAADFIGVA